MTEAAFLIRPLQAEDYEQWLPLWNANNQGHENAAVTTSTWKRLTDKDFPVHGLGAFASDQMAGLLHYVLHHVTGHIAPVCYMQDVYVDQGCRRRGIARALIETLAHTGKAEEWARLYWLAERDNEPAQRLYSTFGIRLDFSLYVLPL